MFGTHGALAQEQATLSILMGSSDDNMYNVIARCCMGHVWLGAADSRQLTQFVDPRADKCH